MPIGKNALKRVSNNGYSNVNTSAPDMENSEVVENKAPVTEEKPATKKATKTTKKVDVPKAKPTDVPAEKAEEKQPETKATPKKSPPKTKKPTTEKPETKKEEESSHPDGFVKVALGMDMPAYLL